MTAALPPSVADLVDRFREHVDAYHGYAEAYKDVIHEDAITVGGAAKAPD